MHIYLFIGVLTMNPKMKIAKPFEILFGVRCLSAQQWGIRLNPAEEKLDLTHYPDEFMEF